MRVTRKFIKMLFKPWLLEFQILFRKNLNFSYMEINKFDFMMSTVLIFETFGAFAIEF